MVRDRIDFSICAQRVHGKEIATADMHGIAGRHHLQFNRDRAQMLQRTCAVT